MKQSENTQLLVIGEGLNKEVLKREFLGNLFPKTCQENKELKAYLKGHSNYSYGTDFRGNPVYFMVRQRYYYVSAN